MQPEKSARMDTGELKAQLLKKVGLDRFKSYFYCLNKFINQKLSKKDFDKSCYRILGRENLPLHNHIIRSILKNACSAKVPPSLVVHEAGAGPAKRSSPVLVDGPVHPSVMAHNQNSVACVWSNGVSSVSPRKVRSGVRDRKLRDRPIPLGKADSASHQSTATEDSGGKIVESGDLTPCDYQRPLKRPRGLTEQPDNEERLIIKKTKDHNNVAVVEDGEEVEQASMLKFSRSPLLAPLGIPYCSASCGGARKALPLTHIGDFASFFDAALLSDSEALRKRMEQIALVQGVEGVSMDCANTLNNMLDVYLKRLIKSCVDLVGARSIGNASKYPMNDSWASNHRHLQSDGGYVEKQIEHHSISVLDFKVAMELNPQQLGEDWPLLFEKISTQYTEE